MPDPALEAAVTHHRAGRLEEAALLYRQLLQTHPNDPEILRLVGFVTAQLGQYAEGVELLKRSIALKPKVGVSYANLAFAYQKLNQRDLAALCFSIPTCPMSGLTSRNYWHPTTASPQPWTHCGWAYP